MSPYNILTIAGTDPSGGAGIHADLKTFSALGGYGASVITALVAQNTCGVQGIFPVTAEFVRQQLDSVLTDLDIASVKMGMLHHQGIIEQVAAGLQHSSIPWRVLDTVMLAKSGDPLLDPEAIRCLCEVLIPEVSIITPNIPEAAALLGCQPAENEAQMREQGEKLLTLGCEAVLMKGGHLQTAESPDWLMTTTCEQRFSQPRIATHNTHGTGCTLSAALAALRPHFTDWAKTTWQAKQWLQGAIAHADELNVGQGHGPVHHFYQQWPVSLPQ
ncbi:bifunctional hydroxymethylpyrimidine kinase/phosphomethylpyrimidine kinase [Rosenbergiella epipactidis]|uniref:bifunctional hydroxymethylpyrimidine kinase/phosphomethylpyrimidine kinase n=1 Tax=Rosenbergiella epipactidis TaxID=1544694 RepID=UPI001F4E5FDA|nr:bifunctional hydroxymethylpyrimidine kinase/phosphomethylpyrimidine kinase [Rosenbergiella epipactidis]